MITFITQVAIDFTTRSISLVMPPPVSTGLILYRDRSQYHIIGHGPVDTTFFTKLQYPNLEQALLLRQEVVGQLIAAGYNNPSDQ